MAYTVNIAKSGSEPDVKVGSFSEPRIAWFELVDLLENGQDDAEEVNDATWKAYEEALDAAFDTQWDAPGSVTVNLDGGISFAVVETVNE
jgi:hypothetical protein